MTTIELPSDPLPTDEEAQAHRQHRDWILSCLDPANFTAPAEKARANASQQSMAITFLSAPHSYRVDPEFLADSIAHIKGELTSDQILAASLERALAADRASNE
jgi:hypothetical protein